MRTESGQQQHGRRRVFDWIIAGVLLASFLAFYGLDLVDSLFATSLRGTAALVVFVGGLLTVIALCVGRACVRTGRVRDTSLIAAVACVAVLGLGFKSLVEERGRWFEVAGERYDDGQYAEATKALERSRACHLVWVPTWGQFRAEITLAKLHCQRGQFDKARAIYKDLATRRWCPRSCRRQAEENTRRLDVGLEILGRYEKWVAREGEFPWDLVPAYYKDESPTTQRIFGLFEIARVCEEDLHYNAKAEQIRENISELARRG